MEGSPMLMDGQDQYCENGYTTKSNLCSMQSPSKFLSQREKSILKFMWKHKRQQIAKAILSKTSNTGGTTILDFRLYYRDIVIKTIWYWHKNKHEDH
jgi:hypothetical protein